MARADPAGALVWDSGQRHTARPWFRLCVLGLVLVIDVFAIAAAPFILANTDEPVVVWIVFGLLAAWTLKLLFEGGLRQDVHLERVTLGTAGLRLSGARLTMGGTAYRPLQVQVGWADVGTVDVVDVDRAHHTATVVDIRLGAASAFGQEVRLVCLNRDRAQAFVDSALALRSNAVPRRSAIGALPARR